MAGRHRGRPDTRRMPVSDDPLPEAGLPEEERLLLRALQAAPRRYLAPPLPALQDVAGHDPRLVLAVALEQAREALDAGGTPPAEAGRAFAAALDALVRDALHPERTGR